MPAHHMHLRDIPFQKIKSGKKSLEYRLLDEKRRLISLGDTIIFENRDQPEENISVIVRALHIFPSFHDFWTTMPLSYHGINNIEEAVQKMAQYFSQENQNEYGIMVIGMECI
jgi:ASC-1-like (ASCH) protein